MLDHARSVRARQNQQNLFWAAIYSVAAIPNAAGALYPLLGVLLRPEWAAEAHPIQQERIDDHRYGLTRSSPAA